MAISVGFGVLFTTFVTLVLVPTLYFIGMDLHRLIFGAEEPVPPGEVSIDSGV